MKFVQVPLAYHTGSWQGNTTTAPKKCAWPRNFKSTGRVGVCKGVGRDQGSGVGDQGKNIELRAKI